MPFDFSPIGLGIDAVTSIASLLGASSAQKRAQERRDSIIQQMKDSNAREYMDVLTGNERSMAARTGGLNASLESTGRSLGAANAAAGVTNSSAVGGSLALGAQGIQQQLAQYALRNRMQEGQLLAGQQRDVLGTEMGAAKSDLGYARDQYQGAVDAFGNVVGQAGQLFGGRGVPDPSTAITSAPGFDPEAPLPGGGQMPAAPGTMPVPGESPGMPIEPGITRGVPLAGGMPVVNPLQAWLQKQTQKNRKMVGGFDARTMGPMVNGMQGAALPAI